MSGILRYITHPQVQIDPLIPVPEWGLSDIGRMRAKQFASLPILEATTAIISSAEKKAIETAEIVSDAIDVSIEVREKTHENDRSATGFLEPKEFELVADNFFAQPTKSIRGWERAIDAQSRIVQEIEQTLERHAQGDLLMVGHGAVGTLLYCHLAKLKISKKYDQPSGGGHMFTYDLSTSAIVHSWKSIEMLASSST